MTTFSQSALGMLRSAESALAGDTVPYKLSSKDGGEAVVAMGYPISSSSAAVMAAPHSDNHLVLILSQQLQHVMREMAQLKTELAAEREGRSETMLALGSRWREAVLVEVRSGDHQLRRDLAEVEERVSIQLKTDAAANAALRRNVEALTRQLKTRDATQFDTQESLRDELDSLRKQVVEATTLCTSVRVETAKQVEQERAALSRRLDVELLRYVDMRQEDQRALQKVKGLVKEELQHVAGTVRGMIDEAWQSCAAALETSTRDALQQCERDGKENKRAVLDMHQVVADCTRTVQAELRVHTTSFKERLASLESNEAVMVSRVDRAEKKADSAHDTVSRLSAEVMSQKESLDRGVAQTQRAAELAQRVESAQLDRDSRLQKVEQHLQATTTAEMLRAEVEGCKRAVGRVESRMEAVGVVCSRAEEAAERCSRGVESAVERTVQSEKAMTRVTLAVQEFGSRVGECERRVAQVEDTKETMAAAAERLDQTSARIEQRVTSTENRLRLISERHEHVTQDLTRTQEAHGARIEAAHEIAARSDGASALAKAEVNRLEKRLVRVEAGVTTFAADCATVHAEVQDGAKALDKVMAQHRHLQERLEASERRLTERAGALDSLDATVADAVASVESKLDKKLASLADNTQERLEEMQAQVREAAGKEDAVRRITHRVNEWQSKVRDYVTEQYRNIKHRCETIEQTVQEQQGKLVEVSEKNSQECAAEMQRVRNTVSQLASVTEQKVTQCVQGLSAANDNLQELQAAVESCQSELGHSRRAQQEAEKRYTAHQAELQRLQAELHAFRLSHAEDMKRTLTTVSGLSRGLAGSAERPLTGQSTSSTMMAANSADVSSPSAHIPSPHRTGSGAESSATTLAQAPQATAETLPPLTTTAQPSSGSRATSSSPPTDDRRGHDAQPSRSHISSISSVRIGTDQQALPSGSNSSARASSSAGADVEQPAAGPAQPLPLPSTVETSGVNTSGQRTIIQRFTAFDDSTTEDVDSAVSGRGHLMLDDVPTEDITSTTTTPSRPAAPRLAVPPGQSPSHDDDEEEEEEEEEETGTSAATPALSAGTPAQVAPIPQQSRVPGMGKDTDEDTTASAAALHSSSRPVTRLNEKRRADADWDEEQEDSASQSLAIGSSHPTTGGIMNAGEDVSEESDEDNLVLPMTAHAPHVRQGATAASPSPARPSAAATGGVLQATPRKTFVHSSDDDDPLRDEEVPTHGKSTTTSSSSGERRSASAISATTTTANAAVASVPQGAARPTGARYTSFDESSEDDD